MPAPTRQPPTQQYAGLTIVLSNPSRFDTHALLTGNAGGRYNAECLQPHGVSLWNCDIRTADSRGPLLPGTKAVLLLGDRAFQEWTGLRYKEYSLNEQRGYPLVLQQDSSAIAIASYLPQEAVDYKDHESRLNPLLAAQAAGSGEFAGASDDGEDDDDVKRHGQTSFSNYFHWLQRDTAKALWLCQAGNSPRRPRHNIILCPPSADIITTLNSHKDEDLYLDIETDIVDRNLLCIGFSFGDSSSDNPTYVVPFLRWNYTLAYSDYAAILRAFSVALRRNTVVCHNAMFDLSVLAHRYSLPFGVSVYDTMLAQHRIYPEAEKSLGHSLSAWPTIWEPFHKDEGVFPPHNPDQERQLWTYNAKDVWAMKLIKEAQTEYVCDDAGLRASIAQANSMIRPYIIVQLQGMRYRHDMREATLKENDRLMTHYLRAIKILVGRELLPTSWQQCGKYLYEELGYDAPSKTKTGNPSTDDKSIQKLKLKYPANAVLDFILAYRERAKESGQLKFTPWVQPAPPQMKLAI